MLRPLSALQAQALCFPDIRPAFFLAAQFAQGSGTQTIYCWNGRGNYTVSGIEYTGIGSLMQVSQIENAPDGAAGITARNVTLTLSGFDPVMLAAGLNDFLQGGYLYISIAFFDPSGNIITLPSVCFAGQMDVLSVSGNGASTTITVSAENVLVDLNRSRERLYTNADIHQEHPLDQCCSFVVDVAQIPLYFGSAPSKVNNGVSAG